MGLALFTLLLHRAHNSITTRLSLFLVLFVPSSGTQKSGMLPSIHWTIERVIAVGMLPLYPIALYVENPTTNFLVVTAVSLHAYW